MSLCWSGLSLESILPPSDWAIVCASFRSSTGIVEVDTTERVGDVLRQLSPPDGLCFEVNMHDFVTAFVNSRLNGWLIVRRVRDTIIDI